MKRADIGKGRIYTNGKGRYRVVLDEPVNAKFEDPDGILFRPYRWNRRIRMVLDYGAMDFRERSTDGAHTGSCTKTSFASWAKAEVLAEDADGNSVPAHHDITNIEESRKARK